MKKIIASSAVCLIALGAGLSVSAAETNVDKGTTDVRIGFENDSTVTPVNPGTLGLSRIPTAFDFGQSNRITDRPQVIKTFNSNSKAPQYLAVNDLREERKGGWKVTATASEIVNMDQEKSATDKLTGANISFTAKGMSFETTDKEGKPYNNANLGVSSVSKLAPNQTGQVVLNTTDASAFGDVTELGAQITDVSLYVPANTGTPNASYSGTVTWSLDNVTQG